MAWRGMSIVPLTLKQANELVARWHRHHKPVRGHRFSIGCVINGELVGAAIVGRPTGTKNPQYEWAEVLRLVTDGRRRKLLDRDGRPHTVAICSKLYGTCARICKEMGFERIQTFTLSREKGTSLRAVGWTPDRLTGGRDWVRPTRPGRRRDQAAGPKRRWYRELCG